MQYAYQKSEVSELGTFNEEAANDVEDGVTRDDEDVVETVHAEEEQERDDVVFVDDRVDVVAHDFYDFLLLFFEDDAQGHEND